jgi:cytochrome b6-f complex iron-sulfur subunit
VAELDRRTVFQGAGLMAGLTLVQACGGGSDEGSPAPTRAATSTEPAPSPTPEVLVALADIPVGGAVSAQTSLGEKLILARPTATTAVGFSAKCPHRGCTVAPATGKIACPCHGSTYNTTTGERLGGPTPTGLAPFPVKVQGGNVVTA